MPFDFFIIGDSMIGSL